MQTCKDGQILDEYDTTHMANKRKNENGGKRAKAKERIKRRG